ncbi:MAG: hypothetical protein WCD18_20755, partial [Thermosynechococcaceae cyanobacterium]
HGGDSRCLGLTPYHINSFMRMKQPWATTPAAPRICPSLPQAAPKTPTTPPAKTLHLSLYDRPSLIQMMKRGVPDWMLFLRKPQQLRFQRIPKQLEVRHLQFGQGLGDRTLEIQHQLNGFHRLTFCEQ